MVMIEIFVVDAMMHPKDMVMHGDVDGRYEGKGFFIFGGRATIHSYLFLRRSSHCRLLLRMINKSDISYGGT